MAENDNMADYAAQAKLREEQIAASRNEADNQPDIMEEARSAGFDYGESFPPEDENIESTLKQQRSQARLNNLKKMAREKIKKAQAMIKKVQQVLKVAKTARTIWIAICAIVATIANPYFWGGVAIAVFVIIFFYWLNQHPWIKETLSIFPGFSSMVWGLFHK